VFRKGFYINKLCCLVACIQKIFETWLMLCALCGYDFIDLEIKSEIKLVEQIALKLFKIIFYPFPYIIS